MRTIFAGLVVSALLTIGCSNPNGPTDTANVVKMNTWASLHATEDCIKATRYDAVSGRYVDYGVLVPKPASSIAIVMPISFCNPAE